MNRFLTAFGLIVVSIVLCAEAGAAVPCESLSFIKAGSEVFQSAQVRETPSGKAYFHDREGQCAKDACQRKGYLVQGDSLVVTTVSDGWACGFYVGAKRDTVGWLRAEQLEIASPERNPIADAWGGRWVYGRNNIRIERGEKPGTLKVIGVAIWGAGPAPNNGLVEASMKPISNHAVVSDDGCDVRMTLVGEWLVVSDNGHCGGMNVYFNGIYRKGAKDKPDVH